MHTNTKGLAACLMCALSETTAPMAVQAQQTAIKIYGLRADVLERMAPQPTTPGKGGVVHMETLSVIYMTGYMVHCMLNMLHARKSDRLPLTYH
jgi:hypothetical protein